MSDWSEHLVIAKQHLRRAENSLALSRKAEGGRELLKAIDALADILEDFDPIVISRVVP